MASHANGTPFAGLHPEPVPACAVTRIPHPHTPLWLAVRACDAFSPYSAEQAQAFGGAGHAAQPWATRLREFAAPGFEFTVIGNGGTCLPVGPRCTRGIGLLAHLTWPRAFEDRLLSLFRTHPADSLAKE